MQSTRSPFHAARDRADFLYAVTGILPMSFGPDSPREIVREYEQRYAAFILPINGCGNPESTRHRSNREEAYRAHFMAHGEFPLRPILSFNTGSL